MTIYGRQIYQIGTNVIAARHAGIRVGRIKMGLFIASGLTSAIAGLMTASRLGSVRYDLASGGELQMVLIVMLGGTYIFGGRGTILGHVPRGVAAGHHRHRHDRRQHRHHRPAHRDGPSAHRLHHRHQLDLFPQPEMTARANRQQTREEPMLKKKLIAAIAVGAGLLAAGQAFAADPVSIVYIPKNTGNPYFNSIIKGFEDGCKQLGCEFTTVAPATAEATSQIPFVTAQIQRGVNVLDDLAEQPGRAEPGLRPGAQPGTLVFSVNSDMPGNQDHRDAAILPVDFTKTGPRRGRADGLADRL